MRAGEAELHLQRLKLCFQWTAFLRISELNQSIYQESQSKWFCKAEWTNQEYIFPSWLTLVKLSWLLLQLTSPCTEIQLKTFYYEYSRKKKEKGKEKQWEKKSVRNQRTHTLQHKTQQGNIHTYMFTRTTIHMHTHTPYIHRKQKDYTKKNNFRIIALWEKYSIQKHQNNIRFAIVNKLKSNLRGKNGLTYSKSLTKTGIFTKIVLK